MIRNFFPRRFDNFAYVPSNGASGGIIIVWNSAMFTGTLVQSHSFGIVVRFTSVHNSESRTLVNVYGPCSGTARDDFVQWLYDLNIPFGENGCCWETLISSDALITGIYLVVILMTSSFSMRSLAILG